MALFCLIVIALSVYLSIAYILAGAILAGVLWLLGAVIWSSVMATYIRNM